jgi:hypothetical protein
MSDVVPSSKVYLADEEKEWKVMNKMKKDPRATMKALGRGMLNMVK